MHQIIPMIVGTVVNMSVGVAVEATTKLVTPAGVRAVSGFLLKGASLIVGGVIANKVAQIAVDNTEAVIEIVQKDPAAVEASGSDN